MFFNFLPFVGSTCNSLEHMTRHAERKLMLSDKHLLGPFFPKQRCLFVAMGAHDCFHVRFESARCFYHLSRPECIRGCDHQHLRPSDMRLNEHARIGGIPRDSRYTAFAQPLDDFPVLFSTTIGTSRSINASPMRLPTRP
jgi:hypothetical protein